jgi:hypothetical protein
MLTDKERIRAVEVHQKIVDQKLENIDEKLDQLLAIRWKGAGAFWLASALLGTGIIGLISSAIDWFK